MTRRARKPFITEKKGKLYYRQTWSEEGKRRERYMPLPGPEDSPEFDKEYWAIRSGRSFLVQPAPKKNVAALVGSYRASSAYKRLAPSTKRKYDTVLEMLREKNGTVDVTKIKRTTVRAIHEKYADKPRKADHILQVLKLLLNYARTELDWIEANPAEGIKLFGPQTEFRPWPEEAQAAFVAACREASEGLLLTAFHLGTGTGQRAGDLCKMEWAHFDGEYIQVVQDKTGARLSVYCPPDLKAHLDALPRTGRFILAKSPTEPITYDALSNRFRRIRTNLGGPYSDLVMHGWRYTAAVSLAEAGCSDAEIQAVTGHRTLAMVQKYRQRAAQRALSKRAQTRRSAESEQNGKVGTDVGTSFSLAATPDRSDG